MDRRLDWYVSAARLAWTLALQADGDIRPTVCRAQDLGACASVRVKVKSEDVIPAAPADPSLTAT